MSISRSHPVATAFGAGFAGSYDSTSLFDRLVTKLGGVSAVQDATLTFAVNGGAAQTLTFGTGKGQISTFAEFSAALGTLSGLTANLSGTTLNIQVPSNTVQTSLSVGGSSNAAIAVALGLSTSTQTGAASPTQDNATRTNLQSDYNNILLQIDNLVKDSSYNGINLLYGDDLKLIFNEDGSSSLTISGVTFTAAGLGLTAVNGSNGSGFQDNDIVDGTLGLLDSTLTTLRTQASKFGTNLTTVQTRQDFTKQLINTLQTGADSLVLADTNEEGANMLALQTRQQLSTTALSLANQASQAVLRLFG
jgi:flagellin